MKIVCMIPARLGSSRVKKKNLRILGDKPLVAHVLQTCTSSGLFEEVYLNSESEIFSEIANSYNAKFYKRSPHLSTESATNDEFMEDFLQNIDCDAVVQVNPTAPFIGKDDLESIVKMLKEGFKTIQSLKEERIEGIYKDKPLNFDPMKAMPPSQDLEPVYLFSSAAMGFNKETFLSNMKKHKAATYGADEKTGFHIMKGFSTVDIDYEKDFALAEVIYKSRNGEDKKTVPQYYGDDYQNSKSDADRNLILKMDGVSSFANDLGNKEVVEINAIIEQYGRNKSWAHTLVDSPSNSSTLIGQMPGEGNRMHHHPDWDEWWYIIEGEWEWTVEGKNVRVKKGDLVFIQRNRKHKITAVGDKMAIRMAVSRADVVHVYNSEHY